jgi:hypothetical protein
VSSDRGLLDVSEALELRYAGLTNWTFYARGDWLQGSGNLDETWDNLTGGATIVTGPPTHALLAFHQALLELEAEGGIAARAARYSANHATLLAGMHDLSFETYLKPADQSYIITSFRYPRHPNFSFERFYKSLNDKGYVIYPGKVGSADCFRIGDLGWRRSRYWQIDAPPPGDEPNRIEREKNNYGHFSLIIMQEM